MSAGADYIVDNFEEFFIFQARVAGKQLANRRV